MINEKEFQSKINRRLSGIAASEQRRMRIRAAVNSEREEKEPMRRTCSKALAFAAAAVMLAATVAFAEHLNLFHFFGERDERYNAVAPYAALAFTDPVLAEHPNLGSAVASIDSAYFDGLSLNLAFRITQGQEVEEYSPTEDELARMEKGDPGTLVADLLENEPGIEILEAWNQAIANGTPYGYRRTAVYASDHTITDDGVDISPDSASPRYNENGDFCEMREFECPLPDEIRSREALKINIGICQRNSYYWFDGKDCFCRIEHGGIGAMTAVIPRNGETRRFSGCGEINGVSCTVSAEVSPMASVITFRSDAPMNAFLSAPPEGTDEYDCWVEAILVDENGKKYRPQRGIMLDDGSQFALPLCGTGVLPEELTVYVYSMWEGIDEPDISSLEGIVLKAGR